MSRVKIISLGYAVPGFPYTQAQIFEAMGYPRPFWRIFRDAQIDSRHFCVPIEKIRTLSFQEQQEHYLIEAQKLALKAAMDCLDGRNAQDIGLVTYSTCTGFPPGPTIGHYLAADLRLSNDIQINNLSSQGCEAAFPGLRRCHDFTALNGKPSLVIACELTSLTYFPEDGSKPDQENDYELLRSTAVFADGCSCALLGYDDDPRHPEIIDFTSYIDTDYMGELGYVWRNGRLRVRLSKRVPALASMLFETTILNLLKRNHLNVRDVSHWVLHPPGAAVLDMVRDKLHIDEEKLKYSRKTLRLFGNTSSSSVGIVAKLLISEEKDPRGYLVMANVGPGMACNAALMSFGD
jgi:alkylresorcinol/alkylpyrone synthase